MKIGIPRAMLYYKNEKFWITLLGELGVEYVLSPETTKEIVDRGTKLAIDEACLPQKIMLGHVDYLIDKCDYIFVPRIQFYGGKEICTRFLALPDLITNTFRGKDIKLLYYNVRKNKKDYEWSAVKKMCAFLGIKKRKGKEAYLKAKQTQFYFELFRTQKQETDILNSNKIKVLVVAHAYNIGDKYVSGEILKTLKDLGCQPVIAEYASATECLNLSKDLTKTMPWAYNRHLLGAIKLYQDKVDGVILLTTFPCGTDSMANELIVRTFKNIPIITMTMDSQNGSAGVETRLESFVDILSFKKEGIR